MKTLILRSSSTRYRHNVWAPLVLFIFAFSRANLVANPVPDGGPYYETIDGLTWRFMVENGKAQISAPEQGGGYSIPSVAGLSSDSVSVPLSLGGCDVVAIGYQSFGGCGGLRRVELHEMIVRIDDAAFIGSGITNIVIPSSVKIIGAVARSATNGST